MSIETVAGIATICLAGAGSLAMVALTALIVVTLWRER